MKSKKIPLRTCIITKTQAEKKEMFRIVRDKDSNVFIDDTYKANGRGCYLLKDKVVIEKAKLGRVIDKHLNVKVEDVIYDELINKL